MACCTYLSQDEFTRPTSDAELNSLLAEVRLATGDDWRIGEQTFEIRRWFRKPQIVRWYEIYNHVSGPEFQVINFYRPDRADEWTINLWNDAGYVAAYLYGVLAGAMKGNLV